MMAEFTGLLGYWLMYQSYYFIYIICLLIFGFHWFRGERGYSWSYQLRAEVAAMLYSRHLLVGMIVISLKWRIGILRIIRWWDDRADFISIFTARRLCQPANTITTPRRRLHYHIYFAHFITAFASNIICFYMYDIIFDLPASFIFILPQEHLFQWAPARLAYSYTYPLPEKALMVTPALRHDINYRRRATVNAQLYFLSVWYTLRAREYRKRKIMRIYSVFLADISFLALFWGW